MPAELYPMLISNRLLIFEGYDVAQRLMRAFENNDEGATIR